MWLVATIVTTLLWGFAELFYKKGAGPDEQYAHLKTCICVGFVMGIHAVSTLLFGNISYSPLHLIEYLPVSLCYILSMALSFFGMRYIEESISDPIENTSGAICSILCVFILKESISWVSALAIAVMVAGILGIGFLEKTDISDRRKKYGKRLAAAAFAMPFCYAIIDALGSFLDVYYLEMETSPLTGVTEETIENVANTAYELTFALVALIMLIFMKVKKVRFNLPGQKDKILAAVFETGGQFTYVFAMSGNGAVAAPIISSVCVVSLLLSRVILKEKLSNKQYFFIFLVILGIIVLSAIEG